MITDNDFAFAFAKGFVGTRRRGEDTGLSDAARADAGLEASLRGNMNMMAAFKKADSFPTSSDAAKREALLAMRENFLRAALGRRRGRSADCSNCLR